MREHPGEYLLDELETRGMSQAELARRCSRPPQVINEIIKGKKSITAQTAIELSNVLGTSAILWLNLQSTYDLAVARASYSSEG